MWDCDLEDALSSYSQISYVNVVELECIGTCVQFWCDVQAFPPRTLDTRQSLETTHSR